VAVNCGAMPENLIESELFGHVRGAFTGAESDRAGRFESASGGTLLLDEVGELPAGAQVKLLRVLDSGVIERVGSSKSVPLDVRVLASTNRDLGEDVRGGRFRQDLYYRLAVLEIALPPLRDRREDILPLAEHFLARASRGSAAAASATLAPALDPQAAEALLRHDWPGNVRELKNAVEHATAVAPGRSIALEDLPESIRLSRPAREGGGDALGQAAVDVLGQAAIDALGQAAVDFALALADPAAGRLRSAVEHAERALILHAMKRFAGNQSEAADFLGLHRNTLRNKLRELHIEDLEDPG
jgi:DNA-binding NtrC family response regulator